MQLPRDFKFTDTVHDADERIPLEAVDFGARAIYELLPTATVTSMICSGLGDRLASAPTRYTGKVDRRLPIGGAWKKQRSKLYAIVAQSVIAGMVTGIAALVGSGVRVHRG